MKGIHMNRAIRTVLVLLVVLSLGVAGCSSSAKSESADVAAALMAVNDLAGREVIVPAELERVVAIGPGALRLVVYAGGADRVVGVEEIEKKPPISRPYTIANPDLLKLPTIGPGGPDSTLDHELLLSVRPDVIFVSQLADAQAADKLQSATGVPVVVLSYGSVGSFDEALFTSLDVVGTVIGSTARSDEVAEYIRTAWEDLSLRTADIPEGEKPTVFVGALGFKGMQGIESTQAKYPPFDALSARNVAGDLEMPGSVIIDKEKLLEWDPQYLFLDRSGLRLVTDDAAVNRAFYEGLSAVEEGRVYSQLPFNNYWTNVEIALADAYYAGTVMFPEEFADIDPAAKADEISTFLVGAPVYDSLSEMYGGGFGAIELLKK